MKKIENELATIKTVFSSLYNRSSNSIERYEIREAVLKMLDEVRDDHRNTSREQQTDVLSELDGITPTLENVISASYKTLASKVVESFNNPKLSYSTEDVIATLKRMVNEHDGTTMSFMDSLNITASSLVLELVEKVGFDSLDIFETLMNIEEVYDIDIQDSEITSKTTIEDLRNLINSKKFF